MRLVTTGLKIATLFAAMLAIAACKSTSAPPTGNGEAATGIAPTPPAMVADQSSDEYFRSVVGDRVYFDFDRAAIRSDAAAVLDRQAAWLKQFPNKTLTIEGHCDERGTREYNLALGERRAHSVKKYLAAAGVDPSRLSTISYGKERPVCTDHAESCWSQNRRAVSNPGG